MKVTRLQLGAYANHQPFCMYQFSLVPSSPTQEPQEPQETLRPTYQTFYRLRDIDAVFFQANPGYVYSSGKIPQVYFETPGYLFYERSGDVYLSARALGETAKHFGNGLLEDLCRLGKHEIVSGVADQLLSRVLTVRGPYAEAELELDASDLPVRSPSLDGHATALERTSPRSDHPAQTSNSSSPRERPCPPANTRKRSPQSRMSLSEVLDNDDTDSRSPAAIKQEPSPEYSGSEHSSPSSPDQVPQSVNVTNDGTALATNDESRRKRRRVNCGGMANNQLKVMNNPEVMEQLRNTIRLRKQKATVDSRVHHHQVPQQLMLHRDYIDRRHSVAVAGYGQYTSSTPSSRGWDGSGRPPGLMAKRHSMSASRTNRNSRNLVVFTQSNSTARPMPLPAPRQPQMPTPVSSVPRLSITEHSSSSPAIHKPQPIHAASTSANINGLISPQTSEFPVTSTTSASTSPVPSSSNSLSPQSTQSTLTHSSTLAVEPVSKESFLQVFDSLYDTVQDSRALKSTLDDQIRKSTTLLHTLQASGSMIENLVRGHFREMQREVVKDLVTLEKRIARVEERIRHSPVLSTPPLDPDRRPSDTSDLSYRSGTSAPNSTRVSVSGASVSSPPLSASLPAGGNPEGSPMDVLSALRARLESLERRMSVS